MAAKKKASKSSSPSKSSPSKSSPSKSSQATAVLVVDCHDSKGKFHPEGTELHDTDVKGARVFGAVDGGACDFPVEAVKSL